MLERGRVSLWGLVLVALSFGVVAGTAATAMAAAPSRTLRLISPGGTGGDVRFARASADGSRVFLSTVEQLTAEDTDAARDVYARNANGTLQLISTGTVNTGALFEGASVDGSRVFFRTSERLVGEDGDLAGDVYAHDPDGRVRLVSGGAGDTTAIFEGASVDGRRVFFATNERLVGEDRDLGTDVYESGPNGIRLISGGTADRAAFFRGASADGSRVFFVTDESLADEDGDLGVDVYERGPNGIRLVSGSAATAGKAGKIASFRAASADGSRVFFETFDPLTDDDQDTDLDVYEGDAHGTLQLISAGTDNAEDAFAGASVDGSRVFYRSGQRLTDADKDDAEDVYERDGDGEPRLISPGTAEKDASLDGVSADGSRVFFSSEEALSAEDTDAFGDVYERDVDGSVRLVSRGTADTAARFARASADGSRVFFATLDPITPAPDDTFLGIFERTPDGAVRLLAGGPNGHVFPAGVSVDGSRVFVETAEAIAGTGDADAGLDVFESALAVPSFGGGANVSGRPRVGSRLTCTPGGVVGENVGSSLAWLRDGVAIPGASSRDVHGRQA